jgi:hypothetical protein
VAEPSLSMPTDGANRSLVELQLADGSVQLAVAVVKMPKLT